MYYEIDLKQNNHNEHFISKVDILFVVGNLSHKVGIVDLPWVSQDSCSQLEGSQSVVMSTPWLEVDYILGDNNCTPVEEGKEWRCWRVVADKVGVGKVWVVGFAEKR